MSAFEFQRDSDGSLDLRAAVFQALGAASMCWDAPEGAGEFRSDQALEIGDRLLEFIEQYEQ